MAHLKLFYSIVILAIVCLCFVDVQSQICASRVTTYKDVTETVAVPKLFSTIRCLDLLCLFPVVDNKIMLVNEQQVKKKPFEEIVDGCCQGYVQTSTQPLTCNPVCNPPCKNGHCAAPNVCVCNTNYENHPYIPFVCQPTCRQNCSNGLCTAPNYCQCNQGYQWKGQSCQPSITNKSSRYDDIDNRSQPQ